MSTNRGTVVRRLALVPLLLIASLLPFSAGAVGLGSIEMSSALNQRLDAEIPLRGVSPEQADRVTVGLASERAFREVGLPRPLFLTHLRFEVIERDGSLFVHVTSRERITEPFLSFLLEVDAPSGSLRREYTVLLDPPVYASDEAEPAVEPEPERAEPEVEPEPAAVTDPEPEPEVAEATEPAAEPTAETRRRDQRFGDEPVFLQVERERDEAEEERRREAERLAAEEEERRARAEREAAEPTFPDSYETASGDTAWDIAARLTDDETSVQQMMLALLRYNPEAFVDGNINRLRSGYVLRVPSAEEARAIDAQTAIAQVDQQNTLWREWRDQLRRTAEAPAGEDPAPEAAEVAAVDDEAPSEELRIVGAPDGGEVAAEDDATPGTAEAAEELQLAREQLESTRMERDELASRVGDLESTVERMERLITVREEQLRALQDRLIEVAEREGIELDPEMFPDEDMVSEDIVAEDVAAEPEALDIEIVTVDDIDSRLADAGAERRDVLVAEAEAAAEEAAAEEAAVEEDEEAAVAVVDDPGVQTERMQPQDDGWLGWLSAPLAGVLGVVGAASAAMPGGNMGLAGAGIAILLLLGLLVMRRRQEAAAEAAGAEIDLEDDVAEDFADLIGADDDATEALTAEADAADDSGLQDPPIGGDADEQTATRALTDEDPLAALDEDEVDTSEGEKDDTIAEAEVYLAYGLHQQARDLLTLALQESPRRADYHEKLLETLYSAGEREEFESQAERFHQVIDGGNRDLWKRVVAMGRDIAPENPLFRDAEDPGLSTADLRPEKPASTDFELDGGETREVDLDFSLDEDAADMESTQLDLGEDETPAARPDADGGFDQTVRMSAETASASGLADGLAGLMDNDDERRADADPEETQFVAAGESEQGEVEDLEFDLGDLEDFAAEDDAEERSSAPAQRSDDSPPTQNAAAGDDDEDHGLEFDLSDFDEPAAGPAEDTGEAATDEADFDLDLDSATRGADAADAATDQSAADDDFSFDLSDLEAQEEEASNLREQSSPASSDDSTQEGADTSEFDLADLEAALDGDIEASADGGPDEERREDATSSSLAHPEPAGPAAGDREAVEDLEATVAGSVADHDVAADIEFDLDDLDSLAPAEAAEGDSRKDGGNGHDAGLAAMEETGEGDDELDTMLDLARAYIDMGDEESATSALEEVIAGGSERQRQEAQKLLDSAR